MHIVVISKVLDISDYSASEAHHSIDNTEKPKARRNDSKDLHHWTGNANLGVEQASGFKVHSGDAKSWSTDTADDNGAHVGHMYR